MKKSILMLLAVLLIAGCKNKEERKTKAPIRVTTQVVSTDDEKNGQTYVGIVEEREATAVSFTSMGVVKRVLVSEGQPVSRGQLIAEMDDTQARNLLANAEASMTQANDALQRYGMLHDNNSLPEVQWVEIQSKVAQAKSQLEVAKKNLSDCRLTAPVSGIIGRKQIMAGETALPSQAVVTILDISQVKVKVAIPESGVYEITYDELREMGFSNPARVKVYGHGGNRIPEVMTSGNYIDDLRKVPILRITDSKICFYANGPVGMTLSDYSSTPHYTRQFNPYSLVGYYFLTEDNTSDLKPSKRSPVTVSNYVDTPTSLGYFFHEKELNKESRAP